ncbi:hypothetical protein E3Q18_03511 [Wallemia mellicola]|nr:hypothetical protein E3Q18_03511 [Wallemia mellicola]TIC25352.1 hypothetical protein E3Q11_03399 [Wallemia mellicola]
MNDDNRPLPQGWIKDFDPQYNRPFYVNTNVEPPVSIWVHPLDDPSYNQQSKSSFAPPAGPPPEAAGGSPYSSSHNSPMPQPGSNSPMPPPQQTRQSKSSKFKSMLGLGSSGSSKPSYGQNYAGYGQPQQYGSSYGQQQPYMQPQQGYMQPQQSYMQPQQPMYVQQPVGGGRRMGGGMGSMLPMAGGLGAGMLGGAFLAHEFDESQQDAYQDGYQDGADGDFGGGDMGDF